MSHNPYATPQSTFDGLQEPVARSAWLALFLGLIAPPIAMLYVVRPVRALGYLAVSIINMPVAMVIGATGVAHPIVFSAIVSVLLSLTAAADGYRLARRWSGSALPWYSRAPALVILLVAGWLLILSIRAFIIEPFRMSSGSMQPTIDIGEHILVDKTSYGWNLPLSTRRIVYFAAPARGDVAVFRYPRDPEVHYVMRVVALPQESISYSNKRLKINGTEQPLSEIGQETVTNGQGAAITLMQYRETLYSLTHLILLDPTAQSYYPSSVREFPGRENCRYRAAEFDCTVPAGHYFVMGDNRDHSSDSRYWGFVPEENFVGRVVRVWYSPRNTARAGTSVH